MSNVDDLSGQLPGQVVTVELDDIQATVLRSRPEPYFGTQAGRRRVGLDASALASS